ncbi:hypothetical protein ACF0H2_07005 [Serratia marcescens]
MKVTAAGITGRLQAILSASDSYWGRFKLHLDGQAQDFWRTRQLAMALLGQWRLPPLQAAWDVAGSGRWRDSELVLDKLSTGFDKLKYGLVTVAAPRLSLNQPLRWRRDEQSPQFNGELQLAADKVSFSDGAICRRRCWRCR